MKTKFCLGVFLLAAALLRAQTNDLTALLQQGLFEEQASRNLDAAIADYSSLAAQFDKDRQMAATAVFRLGECYRAQGRTNEAAAQYQRILRDFSDQQTLATLSRQDLAGMGAQSESSNSQARQQQKDLVAKQITLAEQDLADTQNLVDIGKATQVEVRAAEREVLRLRQQLAALDSNQAALLDLSPPAGSEEDQEIQRIQTMIQNSPDLINAPGGDGNTPLNKAAYNGWLKVAAFLLDHGADVNAGGIPPLNCAATAGNRAMTELLLSRGANVNSKGAQGKTPLQIAVEKNYPAVAEVLLANKADVNAPDDFGNTPLVPAAEKRHIKIIQALLAAGANPNLENKNGQTPFSFAAASGSPEIVKLFLAGKADPNGGKLDAPLLAAIHAGDAASVELLLQAGANPNAKGEDDLHPRTFTRFGYPVDRVWETPISLAVTSGQSPMVKLLLKFKADPNNSQTDNQSVLFHAESDTNLLAALLDAGGKADARRSDGWTLLDSAVAETNLTAVQLLLKFKADPNDSQIDGRSLLFRALADTNILEALLDAGAKVDPVTPDETEWTPLGAAANQNNAPAVEILLKHGANPNVRNRNGVTPLHWAAYQRVDRKVFELLLDAKADTNIRNNNGKTPLDLLGESSGQNTSAGGLPVGGLTFQQRLQNILNQSASAGQIKKIKPAGELADLLRQHGALDNLPDWDRIAVSRPAANYSADIFRKGTNDWNHFTLLELIYKTYEGHSQQIPFPDFSRVTVVRPGANGAALKRIEKNLLDSTNNLDFAKDRPLEFGDVVEIPERGHTLAEHDDWLNSQYQKLGWYFKDHAGEVRLVVAGGQTVQVPLNTFVPAQTYLGEVLKSSAQNALTSSSDLSRVKVTRRDLKTKKTDEWILDCSRLNVNSNPIFFNCPDLLLRAGDVIEVPLKP